MDGLDTRALSRIVLVEGWLASTAGEIDEAALVAAIDELSNPLALKGEEPGLSGAMSTQVENNLRPIGAKVAPEINEEQALAWRKAMVMALSDLPGRIATYATAKAIHRPYNFLNQVEAAVREIAAEAIEKQGKALWRMKRWLDEMERSRMPQPQLAAPEEVIADQASVDAFNADMSKIGTKIRMRLGEDGKGMTYEMDPDEHEAERVRNTPLDTASK